MGLEKLGVVVGVHQGSVLSRLLLIIVLEAPSREFHTGCTWGLLYAEYLMISAESIEALLVKLKTWKSEVEKKGLRMNDYGDWHLSGSAEKIWKRSLSVRLE